MNLKWSLCIMLPKQIEKFYAARAEYFKKKHEITQALLDLEFLLDKANAELKSTIDNGFEDSYLINVAKAYNNSKFNDEIVQDFLNKIDVMFFSKLDARLKDKLEATAIQIQYTYNNNLPYKVLSNDEEKDFLKITGPVKITFTDQQREFILSIPVKNSIKTDMVSWSITGAGLYKVRARFDNTTLKTICLVFDSNKVSIAVEHLLSGKFDSKLKVEHINEIAVQTYYDKNYYNYQIGGMNDINLTDEQFIELHDLFSYKDNMSFRALEDFIDGCIDDRNDYISTCK